MKLPIYICWGIFLFFLTWFITSLHRGKSEVGSKNARLLCACTVLIIVFVGSNFLWHCPIGVSISADIEPTGDYAQIFYKYDSRFSELNSSRALNRTGTVSLKVPDGMSVTQFRFDPVESEGRFYLTGMKIKVAGISVAYYSPEELIGELIPAHGITMCITDQGIQLETFNNDPILYMSDDFTEEVNRYIQIFPIAAYMIIFLLGYILYFILSRTRIIMFWNVAVDRICTICKKREFYSLASLVAAVHYLLCLYMQRAYFNFSSGSIERIVAYQTVFYLLLQILWQAVFRILKRVQNGDKNTVSFLKFSGIYFAVMFIFLLLVWPGYYVSDEYVMLYRSTQWEITSVYHFLMQGYLTLLQMLIPGAAGAEIGQILLISTVIGYVFQQIHGCFIKTNWIYLLYIPLLYPAVLMNNLQWQKGIPGAYLEILLLCKITCAFLDKRRITERDVLGWALLTGVTYTLRMDGIYYIIAAPVLVCVLFRKQVKKVMLVGMAAAMVSSCAVLQQIQYGNYAINTHYTLINYARLAFGPLYEADPVQDKEQLDDINTIFDVEKFRAAPSPQAGYHGIKYKIGPTEDEISAYKTAIMKLALKHPKTFIRQQMERFLLSSGFGAYLVGKYDNFTNYQSPDAERWGALRETVHVDDVEANPLNVPFNKSLRMKTILFCMGRNTESFTEFSIRDLLFNNLIPCVLFLVALWIYLLVRKKYGLLGILTLFLLRLPILVASASYVAFQYYFRFFIVGNVIPFFFLGRCLSRKWEKRNCHDSDFS